MTKSIFKKAIPLTVIIGLLSSFAAISSNAANVAPKSYSYTTYTYKSVLLNIIKTNPANIKLKSLNGSSLSSANVTGINGGWISSYSYDGTLNIAVNNGIPVIGKAWSSNSGWYNSVTGKASGTIIWDGGNNRFSYQRVSNASDITGVDKNHNWWAQGGISLSLGNINWMEVYKKEFLNTKDTNIQYFSGDAHPHTALVYSGTSIYLIESDSISDLSNFRYAIQAYFKMSDSKNESSTTKGILLDSNPSSEMKCIKSDGKPFTSKNCGHKLEQVITLINN